MTTLLSLDLSTTCTGYALFDISTKKLLSYGALKPNFKNPTKKGVPLYPHPQSSILKLRELADQVIALMTPDVTKIVIEEINSGKNRLGQKVLDGYHYVLMERMPAEFLSMISFFNTDGSDGWRSRAHLGLQLTQTDKIANKEKKKLNKKRKKGSKKEHVITQKDLACRYVNNRFGLNFDCAINDSDGDIADSIAMGVAYLDANY